MDISLWYSCIFIFTSAFVGYLSWLCDPASHKEHWPQYSGDIRQYVLSYFSYLFI